VTLVDLSSGQIEAEALGGEWISRLAPTPDGRDLYVYAAGRGVAPPGVEILDDAPYWLRRLDAMTLTVRAEREFTGFGHILLQPAAPR
jgi:hypothetical protein